MTRALARPHEIGQPAGDGSIARARVGPNAILQLANVLKEQSGAEVQRQVMSAAGLAHYVDHPLAELVDEAEAARLFAATRMLLPAAEANRLLEEAGRLTGEYIVANRIPKSARRMLQMLPSCLAVRALLTAIKAHAWTFAGSGDVLIGVGLSPGLTIARNPLATPGCPWHVGVLQRLFHKLVTPQLRIKHARRGDCDDFRVVPSTREEGGQ